MKSYRLVFLAILLLPLSAAAQPKHLTILHFNDIHGHLEAGKEGGGAARIATIVHAVEEENRAKGAETIILFGGDAFTGTLLSSEFQGAAEFDFLALLGVGAMVLGNHDFDFGLPRLEELMGRTSFPILSANIFRKGTGERLVRPSVVLSDGLRIGLFGLTSPETPVITAPANVAGLVFTDPVGEARAQIAALESRAPIRIALTHLGVKGDVALAKKVRGLTAVVGGHDHVPPGEYCRTVKRIPVCQTPANGRFVGRIDFEIEGKRTRYSGSSLIPVAAAVAEDGPTVAMIAAYEKRLGPKFDVVVGRASKMLRTERGQRTEFGSLVAEAARRAGKGDVALINGGGIRSPIQSGPIRLRDVIEALPFSNHLVVLDMTGRQIEEAVSFGMKKGGGAFPQLAGIACSGENGRCTDLRNSGAPLAPEKIYRVVTVDFLSSGGDGYAMLKEIPNPKSTDILLRDAFVAYLKKQKVVP